MTWLDGWEQVRGNDSGTWAKQAKHPKLLLHRTEGGTIESALGAYRANNSWPHVTVDTKRRRRMQHLPLDKPARALRNSSVPGETNRTPTVIQVEIVGFSKDSPNMPGDELDWLGTDVVHPLCHAAGIPVYTGVTFYGLDAGFTLARADAPQRLTRRQWDEYEGILAHQHAPENTHWDIGALNIERVMAAAGGAALPPVPKPPAPIKDGFLMDDEARKAFTALNKRLDDIEAKVIGSVWSDEASDVTHYGSLRGWLAAIAAKVGVTREEAIALDPSQKPT